MKKLSNRFLGLAILPLSLAMSINASARTVTLKEWEKMNKTGFKGSYDVPLVKGEDGTLSMRMRDSSGKWKAIVIEGASDEKDPRVKRIRYRINLLKASEERSFADNTDNISLGTSDAGDYITAEKSSLVISNQVDSKLDNRRLDALIKAVSGRKPAEIKAATNTTAPLSGPPAKPSTETLTIDGAAVNSNAGTVSLNGYVPLSPSATGEKPVEASLELPQDIPVEDAKPAAAPASVAVIPSPGPSPEVIALQRDLAAVQGELAALREEGNLERINAKLKERLSNLMAPATYYHTGGASSSLNDDSVLLPLVPGDLRKSIQGFRARNIESAKKLMGLLDQYEAKQAEYKLFKSQRSGAFDFRVQKDVYWLREYKKADVYGANASILDELTRDSEQEGSHLSGWKPYLAQFKTQHEQRAEKIKSASGSAFQSTEDERKKGLDFAAKTEEALVTEIETAKAHAKTVAQARIVAANLALANATDSTKKPESSEVEKASMAAMNEKAAANLDRDNTIAYWDYIADFARLARSKNEAEIKIAVEKLTKTYNWKADTWNQKDDLDKWD